MSGRWGRGWPVDWAVIERELDAQGCARLPSVLSQDLCRELAALYPHDAHFRSRVVMARHGFGRGGTGISPIRCRFRWPRCAA